jgi:hypothetical protein
MRFLTASFLLMVIMAVNGHAADLSRLDNNGIKEKLIGRTAVSTDPEWLYRQYFDSSFDTIYAEKGKRSTLGKWKTGNDLYCSLWAAGEWECFEVWETDEDIVWIDDLSGVRYPARLVDGQELLEPAVERKMTGAEIKEALTGNTAIGLTGTPPFRQFFTADGKTTYADGQRPTTYGEWTVQNNDYCSLWGGGAWSCYAVNETGSGIVWIGKDRGDRYPARILKGYRILE